MCNLARKHQYATLRIDIRLDTIPRRTLTHLDEADLVLLRDLVHTSGAQSMFSALPSISAWGTQF